MKNFLYNDSYADIFCAIAIGFALAALALKYFDVL
jgi:hypothetical protein